MKTLYITIAIILFALPLNLKAQEIYPLNTSFLNSPQNSYFKDTKNELDKFEGTWKSTYEGKSIVLKIEKQIKTYVKLIDNSFYTDQLFIKYEIKDSNNQIIESTLNLNFDSSIGMKFSIKGNDINNNTVTLFNTGKECGIGSGEINLLHNSTTLTWSFKPMTIFTNPINCPNVDDVTINLPITNSLIFTKQ